MNFGADGFIVNISHKLNGFCVLVIVEVENDLCAFGGAVFKLIVDSFLYNAITSNVSTSLVSVFFSELLMTMLDSLSLGLLKELSWTLR